jgi:AcrR family transcriptional regulator
MATREEIVGAAMHLFARRGYARTSIVQIEEAVGLSPGAGGLYRHFASKEAILEAGIDEALAASDKTRSLFTELPRDDPRRALELVATAALELLDRDRDLTVILFKDLDQFPALRDRVKERWIQASYETFASILRHTNAASGDLRAKAAVGLGSLVLYNVLQVVLGEPPGRVTKRRFVAAWLDTIVGAGRPRRETARRRASTGRR